MPKTSARRLILVTALVAATALAGPAPSGPEVAVTLAPALSDRLERSGDAAERAVLRQLATEAMHESVARAIGRGAHRVRVDVVIEDAAPSHPTRAQLARTPSLDALRTHSSGGARLTAEVRDETGRRLARIAHEHYAPDLDRASPAGDPWADARVAIDGAAARLAQALRTAPAQP